MEKVQQGTESLGEITFSHPQMLHPSQRNAGTAADQESELSM